MTEHQNENENRSDEHSSDNTHSGRERPSYDDVNVPVVILVGVISMVLTFVTIWFVEGIFYQWQNNLVRTVNYDKTNLRQVEVLDAQKAIISNGDAEKNIKSVESVVESVLEKYKNEHAANPAQHSEAHDDGH